MKQTKPPEEKHYHTAARNLVLDWEFTKILEKFSAYRIPVIPLKGIAFIQDIYFDLGRRSLGDIDLLVKPDDVIPAVRTLTELGYESGEVHFDPFRPNSIYINSLVFNKTAKVPFFIHLHWHILNTAYPLFMYKIDMEDIWEQARIRTFQNKKVLMMNPHHLIVYISIHALNHFFCKVSLFEDMRESIEYYKNELNWQKVKEIAEKWNALLPTYLTLYFTRRLLDYEYIDTLELLNMLKPQKLSRSAEMIMSRISGDVLGNKRLVKPLYLDMAGGPGRRLKFLRLALFPPLEDMRRIYKVKGNLLPYLYYFRRWGKEIQRTFRPHSPNF